MVRGFYRSLLFFLLHDVAGFFFWVLDDLRVLFGGYAFCLSYYYYYLLLLLLLLPNTLSTYTLSTYTLLFGHHRQAGATYVRVFDLGGVQWDWQREKDDLRGGVWGLEPASWGFQLCNM